MFVVIVMSSKGSGESQRQNKTGDSEMLIHGARMCGTEYVRASPRVLKLLSWVHKSFGVG